MGKASKFHTSFQASLANLFHVVPHDSNERESVILDDHQTEALQEIYEGLLLNRRKMCAVGSCGSGKTIVEIAAILASQNAKKELGINENRQDIVVTEGRTVVNGIRRQFKNLGINTGIWSGGEKELDSPIIVAGIHALQTARKQRKLTDDIKQGTVDLCVIDEVDRFLTKSRIETIDLLQPRIKAGFTATQEWPDGRHISDHYGPIVHDLPLAEAMRQKVNVVPELFVYESEISESDLKIQKDDYDPTVLNAAWRQAELHKAIPEVYNHIVPKNKRRQCPALVYVPSKDMVNATVDSLRQSLDDDTRVVGLTGEDSTNTVNQVTEAYLSGEIQILVLCEMGGRGMNLENAKLLIDAYPTKSLNKLEQRHGRVLRKIRPGSKLHKEGWRKDGAVIAQIIPKSSQFRPALFTDLVGGWQEYQEIRDTSKAGEGGAPESDLIAEIRRTIESKQPPLNLVLRQRIQTLAELMRDLPQADEDGFFRIPRRYIKKDMTN